MSNNDVVKEIAYWALIRKRNEIGEHFDLTDYELTLLIIWLKEDLSKQRLGQAKDAWNQMTRPQRDFFLDWLTEEERDR
tara:strand:+ start:524 stop:760 length:237 start_codon:yes stop_codon:yes gene_type:complete